MSEILCSIFIEVYGPAGYSYLIMQLIKYCLELRSCTLTETLKGWYISLNCSVTSSDLNKMDRLIPLISEERLDFFS
jgi:hypothetical protein